MNQQAVKPKVLFTPTRSEKSQLSSYKLMGKPPTPKPIKIHISTTCFLQPPSL